MDDVVNQVAEMIKANAPDMDLTKRIKEIAIAVAPNYPNVENVTPWEQLWAIEGSYKGVSLACKDLHEEIRTRDIEIESLKKACDVFEKNSEGVTELWEALRDLTERAERARGILKDRQSGGNWGMLDTTKARAALESKHTEKVKEAVEEIRELDKAARKYANGDPAYSWPIVRDQLGETCRAIDAANL